MRSIEDRSVGAVFVIFLRLGLTSFGGPIAHLAYFHDEFVTRRKWLSERSYADLVALCQFLPGPASSQVGMALGLMRSGFAGALAAWAGFTMPSAIALVLFALAVSRFESVMTAGALHGLKVVAVAVVAQAVWGMGRTLCPDRSRMTLMAAATCFVLLLPSVWAQVAVIALAAVVGRLVLQPPPHETHERLPIAIGHRTAVSCLALFSLLLIALPLATSLMPSRTLSIVDAFYRAGSLVFGGGHVVLPLLQAEVVSTGWVSNDAFLAGYGAAQAVPGPLFTFAAFLGASMNEPPSAWIGGLVCLLVIFVPSLLLVIGALPFWERLRRDVRAQSAMAGINAAVVGLLLAALYQTVWMNAIHTPRDFALALVALTALMVWKLPPWLVVAGSAAAAWTWSALM